MRASDMHAGGRHACRLQRTLASVAIASGLCVTKVRTSSGDRLMIMHCTSPVSAMVMCACSSRPLSVAVPADDPPDRTLFTCVQKTS